MQNYAIFLLFASLNRKSQDGKWISFEELFNFFFFSLLVFFVERAAVECNQFSKNISERVEKGKKVNLPQTILLERELEK